jgi:aryl-alcohol dehydrogenase-like predicted oxidoreductase
MKYNFLGASGVKVSEFCLGCMTFGKNQWGVGSLNGRESAELVSTALDHGINFFDTADAYAFGESETLLGQALQGRRNRAVIATKVRIRISSDPNDAGLSRRHIVASCEASLKRLDTDRIDLYQIHGWDPVTPLEETLAALNDLVRQGKVLYLGASNLAAWQLAKAVGLQREYRWSRFVAFQPYYSLAARDIEVEIVPFCLDAGIGILPWSPLAGGYLTGKYRRGETGRRTTMDFPPLDAGRGDRVLDALEQIAASRGTAPAQAALAWTKTRPGVASVIVGARTREQLECNLKASEFTLTEQEILRLNEASAVPVPYPQWMIGFQSQDR